MDMIKEIEEQLEIRKHTKKLCNNPIQINDSIYDVDGDIEYLLAEYKRLRDRTTTYRIALEEIAGYISDDAVFMRETAQEVLSNEALREGGK